MDKDRQISQSQELEGINKSWGGTSTGGRRAVAGLTVLAR